MKKGIAHASFVECVYLACALCFALTLSFLDNLSGPLANIFTSIFTMHANSPIFPFTIAVSALTFVLALVNSKSIVYALSLPFAFLGLFELFWHVIPNSAPINSPGVLFCLSWASIGFASFKKWQVNNQSLLLIALDFAFFCLWYFVGFSESSIDSLVLNIICKVLLGIIFIQIFWSKKSNSISKAESVLLAKKAPPAS